MSCIHRHAIDTMQSVCLMESGVNAPRSLKEETTLIGLTFGGYLRSKVMYSITYHISVVVQLCLNAV